MNKDNCLMCLSSNECNEEIEKKCKGRFVLDEGLSRFYQVICANAGA